MFGDIDSQRDFGDLVGEPIEVLARQRNISIHFVTIVAIDIDVNQENADKSKRTFPRKRRYQRFELRDYARVELVEKLAQAAIPAALSQVFVVALEAALLAVD